MIRKCETEDEIKIYEYIGTQYEKCLYLYLNLRKYGIENKNVNSYIQYNNGKISAIVLFYYSCMHVFSKNNLFDADEIVHLMLTNNATTLYSVKETARLIIYAIPNELKKRMHVNNGWVAKAEKVIPPEEYKAVLPNNEDYIQIATMIFDDPEIGRGYIYNDLVNQIKERSCDGYSRHLVIKQNGLVVAHACTNAEMDGIAVVGELLVRKEYQKKGLGGQIWGELCSALVAEGKEVYSFFFSEESKRIHNRIGFEIICDWTKMIIQDEY